MKKNENKINTGKRIEKFIFLCFLLEACTVFFANARVATGFEAETDVSLAFEDNIYRVIDELAQSDEILRIEPDFSVIGKHSKQKYSLNYSGDYGLFRAIDSANYDDHTVNLKLENDHTIRFQSDLEYEYSIDHEEPGAINRVQLDITEYNKFDLETIGVGLTYGTDDSTGKFELNYKNYSKEYKNNDLYYLNYGADQFLSRFEYRLGVKTRIYFLAVMSEFNYDLYNGYELDNTYNRYKVGLLWQFSEKLEGNVNVGYQGRDYKLENIRDIKGLGYDGDITWLINTYTSLTIDAVRESVDSSIEEAGGLMRTSFSSDLNHDITERLKLSVGIAQAKDELYYSERRVDKRIAYLIKLNYEANRWFDLSASFTHEERDSTLEIAEYEANIFEITATILIGS